MKLWDIGTGRMKRSLDCGQPVYGAAFFPDSRTWRAAWPSTTPCRCGTSPPNASGRCGPTSDWSFALLTVRMVAGWPAARGTRPSSEESRDAVWRRTIAHPCKEFPHAERHQMVNVDCAWDRDGAGLRGGHR